MQLQAKTMHIYLTHKITNVYPKLQDLLGGKGGRKVHWT
jgi:hypothetical protein